MLNNIPQYLANARKAIINLTGLLGSLLGLALIPSPFNDYAATAFAVLTILVHYLTANAAAPGDSPATEEFNPLAEDEDLSESLPDDYKPGKLITPNQIALDRLEPAIPEP